MNPYNQASKTGRITLVNETEPSYPTTHDNNVQHAFSKDVLKGVNVQSTELSDLYFSDTNVSALQQGIRYMVHKKSCGKYVISNQSENELKIIMRSIFLTHAKNMPFNIVEQVRELNAYVLDYAVPRILSELDGYRDYKDDIQTLRVPLTHSVNESIKGTKVVELRSF